MISKPIAQGIASYAHLAEAWLTWRPEGGLPSKRPLSELFSDPSIFPLKRFSDYLCHENRSLYGDDTNFQVEFFRSKVADGVEAGYSALSLLWYATIRGRGLMISFENGAPEIKCPPALFECWMQLVCELDPDAMACLELSVSAHDSGSANYPSTYFDEWPPIFTSGDTDLKRLLATGVSDMHLHMKSLSLAAISWQRIIRDNRILKNTKRFCPETIDGQRRLRPELQREHDFICSGLAAWRRLGPGGIDKNLISDFFYKISDPQAKDKNSQKTWHARSPREILSPYRLRLYSIWRNLTPFSDQERDFEQYLSAKALFRRHHLQHYFDTNPGLAIFDAIRKRLSHLGRFRHDEATRSGFSALRFVLNNGLLVEALKDDPGIRRADLRVAPPEGSPRNLAKNYARLGSGLSKLFDSESGKYDFGTSLHFKRFQGSFNKTDRSRGLPACVPILRKLMEYDLETAGFQLMRFRLSTQKAKNLKGALPTFRRLDLASPERSAGPWLIAPFIRLLRGDSQTFHELRSLPEDTPYAIRWRRLLKHGLSHSAFSFPPLHLTCHAGEDFDTVVQGLSHIDGAIETWHMEPGDSLGHCLALGPSLLEDHSYARMLDHKMIRQGIDLDGLLWLMNYVEVNGLWSPTQHYKLQSAIGQLATQIYGGSAASFPFDPTNITILKEKLRYSDRFLPISGDFQIRKLGFGEKLKEILSIGETPGQTLWLADHFDHTIAEKRQKLIAPSNIHLDLRHHLHDVQSRLLEKIQARGIVIETNPSSNIRMLRLSSAGDLPIIPLSSSPNAPRITICTDNPGVYDTTISNEFALVFGALQSSPVNLSRDAALRILLHMRETGMTKVNW